MGKESFMVVLVWFSSSMPTELCVGKFSLGYDRPSKKLGTVGKGPPHLSQDLDKVSEKDLM